MILGRVVGTITSTINHPFYDAKKLLVVERIDAAIDLATRYVDQAGATLRYRIISRPHQALIKQIETSTWFGSQDVLDLGGEMV